MTAKASDVVAAFTQSLQATPEAWAVDMVPGLGGMIVNAAAGMRVAMFDQSNASGPHGALNSRLSWGLACSRGTCVLLAGSPEAASLEASLDAWAIATGRWADGEPTEVLEAEVGAAPKSVLD